MPSNDELREAAERLIKFNADWHYYYTPGQSIGNPVKVPWDLYQQAIKMAYHVKSTLATTTANTLQPGTDIFRDENCSIVDIDSV